jgi:hypothetical protein
MGWKVLFERGIGRNNGEMERERWGKSKVSWRERKKDGMGSIMGRGKGRKNSDMERERLKKLHGKKERWDVL